MAKSLALGYAMPDDASPSMFDPQTALALMAPGLVGPDGKVDVQSYQNQRMWQGLLGMAAGLLSKSGPSTTPVGFGPALGAGLQGMTEAQQGYDKGTLGGVSAAQAFANIGKLGAEQKLMQGQADAAKKMAALAPQLFSDGGATAPSPAAIAGVPGNVDQVINSPGGSTTAAGGSLSDNFSDPRGVAPLIRAAAVRYGHDPDVAVKVAQSEGLGAFYGDGGKSGTAFQLYTGGGLGNQFQKETGLDPLDPKNEPAAIDWAMRNLSRTGWGPYHGAAKVGIGSRTGIDIGTPGNFPAVPNFAGMMTGNQGVSYAPPTDMATGNAAPSSEPTVSILGPGGRFYNLTSAQADQFYRLDDGPPKQQFLANLSMTRKAPAASASASIAPQSLPGQIQVNGTKIPRPDIAQQMMLYSAISGVKMPSFVEEAAKMPIDQYKKLYDAQVDLQSKWASPEASPQLQGKLQAAKTQQEINARIRAAGLDPNSPEGQAAARNMMTDTRPEAVRLADAANLPPQQRQQVLAGAIPGNAPTGAQKEMRTYLNGTPEEQAALQRAQTMGRPLNLGTIPKDYQVVIGPDGSYQMKIVPGSPTDIAQQSQARGAQISSGIVTTDIDRALPKVGSWTAGPIGALTQRVPGTEAHDLQELLRGIGANISIDRLSQMRQSSPTGGALGNVTEGEHKLLQSTYGSLEQSQGSDQLRYNLQRLRGIYSDIVFGSKPTLDALLRGGKITQSQYDAAIAGHAAQTQGAAGAPAAAPIATPYGTIQKVQ